jgi:hypothetical protein
LTQDKFQVLRATIKGGRGGLQMALALQGKSGIQSIRVADQDLVGTWRLNQADPILARLVGFGERGVPIEIVYDPAKKPSLTLVERSPLPDGREAQTLTAARAPDAAPVHSGDGTVVLREYDLQALTAPPPR